MSKQKNNKGTSVRNPAHTPRAGKKSTGYSKGKSKGIASPVDTHMLDRTSREIVSEIKANQAEIDAKQAMYIAKRALNVDLDAVTVQIGNELGRLVGLFTNTSENIQVAVWESINNVLTDGKLTFNKTVLFPRIITVIIKETQTLAKMVAFRDKLYIKLDDLS